MAQIGEKAYESWDWADIKPCQNYGGNGSETGFI